MKWPNTFLYIGDSDKSDFIITSIQEIFMRLRYAELIGKGKAARQLLKLMTGFRIFIKRFS